MGQEKQALRSDSSSGRFAGRESEKRMFGKELSKVMEDLESNEFTPHVLTFYGIGGIGKSTLKDMISAELDEEVCVARLDFDGWCNVDISFLLEKLYTELVLKGFSFDDFVEKYELAFSKKLTVEQIESNPDIIKDTAMDIVSNAVPFGDLGGDLASGIKRLFNKSKLKQQRAQFGQKTDRQKTEAVIEAFDREIFENISKSGKPLVVFMDTFEFFGELLRQSTNNAGIDEWLKKLVDGSKGVLWVILGRDKLSGEVWKGILTQEIKELSREESLELLELRGVEPASLREELYKLCKGYPLWLEMCTHTYEDISRSKVPELADFGESQERIVERHLMHMNESQRSAVMIMACLSRWDKDLFGEVCDAVGFKHLMTSYSTVVTGTPFIMREGERNGRVFYRMNETVGEIIFNAYYDGREGKDSTGSNEKDVKKILATAMGFLSKELDDEKIDDPEEHKRTVRHILRLLMRYHRGDTEQQQLGFAESLEYLRSLTEDPANLLYVLTVLNDARDIFDTAGYSAAKCNYYFLLSHCYRMVGDLDNGKKYKKLHLDNALAVCGEDSIEAAGAQMSYAEYLEGEAALELMNAAFKTADKYAESDPKFYFGIIFQKSSLEIQMGYSKRVAEQLEALMKVLSEDEKKTGYSYSDEKAHAQFNLAYAYLHLKEYEKCIEYGAAALKSGGSAHVNKHMFISLGAIVPKAFAELGRYEDAANIHRLYYINELKKLVAANSDYMIDAYNTLIYYLNMAGKEDEALAAVKELPLDRQEEYYSKSVAVYSERGDAARTFGYMGLLLDVVRKRCSETGDLESLIAVLSDQASTYQGCGMLERAYELAAEMVEVAQSPIVSRARYIFAQTQLASISIDYDANSEEFRNSKEILEELMSQLEGDVEGEYALAKSSVQSTMFLFYFKLNEREKARALGNEVLSSEAPEDVKQIISQCLDKL